MGTTVIRPIDWVSEPGGRGHVRLLDQTRLPGETVFLDITSVDELVAAIQRLAVRGAPALGVAGALGVVLAVQSLDPAAVPAAVASLRSARPTAVNLAWGVDAAAARIPDGAAAVLETALHIRDADIDASNRMAERGAELLTELLAPERSAAATVLTICNTGSLAAVERGTALAVVDELHRTGRLHRALACETRPLLQGARLTAWELQRMGAPFDLVVDSAAASIIASGRVDAVLAGADRITANGDVANKIGTFALALAARYAGVPMIVVAPESTVDLATGSGAQIEIEDRGSAEVGSFGGVSTAPEGTSALNPAFDVTPAELITAIVTERRVVRTATGERPDDRA